MYYSSIKKLRKEVKNLCKNGNDVWNALDKIALREYMCGNKLVPFNLILWRLQKKFFGFYF